jgi:hypothetical protein
MHVLYLNNGLSSVFESQVLHLLLFYKNTPGVEKVQLCCGYLTNSEKLSFKKLLNHVDIETIYFKSYPNYPFFNFLNRVSLRKALLKGVLLRRDTIIHVRGELLAYHLKKILYRIKFPINQVLIDIRGAAQEEIIEYTNFQFLIKKLKILNYNIALKSLRSYHYINAVSLALKEYISEKLETNDRNIFVISNLAGKHFRYSEEWRFSIREKLGIRTNETLFVFSSGGTGLWQKNQVIIELANNGYKVLNLSKETISHINIINRFVAYNDVSDYLSAADIAVILRDQSIVNEVASPVKFSEFICSGLPVISTKCVRLISDYIASTGYGSVIESIHDITPTIINSLINISRTEIEKYGYKHYGINAIANTYYALYQIMLNDSNTNCV